MDLVAKISDNAARNVSKPLPTDGQYAQNMANASLLDRREMFLVILTAG